jgi:catechol 2,3-dioxygenase-like lactoylglutathione lyase family enzyme
MTRANRGRRRTDDETKGPAMSTFPRLAQVVLDTTDARRLAEFYREFLGFHYRPGEEPPPAGADDAAGREWLVLLHPDGYRAMAFQQVDRLKETTWPDGDVPQQMHLDIVVPDKAELDRQHERAKELGATVRLDRSDDEEEPLRVYADPAGHLFCVFVGTAGPF